MKILVINCGSSSLKFQFIDMENEAVLCKGLCDRIAIDGSLIAYTPAGKEKITKEVELKDHNDAIKCVIEALTNKEDGVIASMDEINAIGHRLVHGGEAFKSSVIITDEVKKTVEEVSDLAPLHNPANLIGVAACEKLMPNTVQVGVFDTAFHQTMPPKAYLYGLPYEYYEKYKVRRYGFHGTSHKFVSERVADILGKDKKDLKTVVCHLGNGASICAVDGGKSVDTSMGLTPLEGLVMGTRSGDIDPAIIQFIANKEGISLDEVTTILNKKSGVLGLSKISNDFRDLEDAVAKGNERAIETMDVYHLRVAKYIGAYAAEMNGIDAIAFTAGLGENNKDVREEVCKYLGYLGVEIDKAKNDVRGKETVVSSDASKVKVLVVPTNEELAIARETRALVE